MPTRVRVLLGSCLAMVLILGIAITAEAEMASYYGGESGGITASGSIFDPFGSTAAHPSLPFGSVLTVCHAGACEDVTVTDRGPYIGGRDIDVSLGTAIRIGMLNCGVCPVEVIYH